MCTPGNCKDNWLPQISQLGQPQIWEPANRENWQPWIWETRQPHARELGATEDLGHLTSGQTRTWATVDLGVDSADFRAKSQILGNSWLPRISHLQELEDQSMGKLGQNWCSWFTQSYRLHEILGNQGSGSRGQPCWFQLSHMMCTGQPRKKK